MKQTQKICAAYIRVSTHDQEEYSPESQIKLVRDYAKRNGWLLPEEFVFRDDGISGRTAEKRPGFLRMIATARQKPQPFSCILVWKFSRFARNQEESIVYKSLLKRENDVDVVSISEPLVEGPFGELIERIIEWFDAFYSANLGTEVRRGMTERAGRGLPVSTAPLGYTYQDKALVIVPEEAEVVRMIYREFLDGIPMIAIAKKLNDMGIKTKRKGSWENRTVRYILTNPTYAGKLRWCPSGSNDYHGSSLRDDTIIVEGEHEPIITPADFEEAQIRIAEYLKHYKGCGQKAQRQQASRMLQGLVRCSACGSTLSFTGAGMNCSGYIHGRCKVSHFSSVHKLEELSISALRAQMENLELNIIARQSTDTEEERRRLERLLKKEEDVLRRYKEAYAEGVDTLEEYREHKAASQQRTAQWQAELAKLAAPPAIDPAAFAAQHRDAVEALAGDVLTGQEKNQLLRGFVDHMVFHKDTKTVEVVYYI